jgi:hypothetical protein
MSAGISVQRHACRHGLFSAGQLCLAADAYLKAKIPLR